MKRKRSKKSSGKDELNLGLEVETPGVSAQNPISVTNLTATIRELLETGLGEIWVAGEISNFRAPGSGHLYFTLKDETATLSAVMFQREARRAGFVPADGQAVLARGTITVYEARGQYQIQVAELCPRGQGSLQQRFEELKRRLEAENLFALERKRPLPVFPEVIGIVTSLQGAVLQDMLQILQRRAPGIRIRVRGVRVQGVGSAQEIAQAVAAFSAEKNIDLLVVARGGGSLEDLWAFNEEAVARALAACAVPTVSAVGHETDFTIADFVADLRAPTPSAAAELLTRDWTEWREEVAGLRVRLDRTTRQVLGDHRRHLARLASSYALREPRRVVRQWAQRLDDIRENFRAAAGRAIQSRRHALRLLQARLGAHHPARELERRRGHLTQLAARLRALGPQGTLDRGYALVLDRRGRPLSHAKKEMEGKPVRIVLSKGIVGANLTEAHPGKTLVDALRPQGSEAKPVPPKKTKPRRKK
ncbi:MAG TPA: exodeoxyribonuclease VII large subunit [Candidatus Methylacidiphilales bacterium]|jgi:exodeoxyribonuclease VII large subunit|nr:exodeoxyribonuclease VII large subunit [Candidatus Methylacidiphilales bacterium]